MKITMNIVNILFYFHFYFLFFKKFFFIIILYLLFMIEIFQYSNLFNLI